MTESRVSPVRFLVVEDEAVLAMDISMMIEDLGHTVVAEAACLRELAEVTGSIEPNVAFVDLQLAEGSTGLEVCEHIRHNWADAIIVFVTGNPKALPADYAGGHGVISKPFSRNGMKSAVRYLAEGISDPPPSLPRPAEFKASNSLEARLKRPSRH